MTARRHDVILAVALAAVLSLAWAMGAWGDLSRLRLPDTDDMMRLQQVRDWLGGQAFADVAQHRLGLGGPIHWSRLADLPIAALIRLLAPLGRHDAEIAAVILWPGLLFASALFLVVRIARALDAPPATAAILAAIAYPATTIFLPGRIDHHGLQLVLLLGVALAVLGPATLWRGMAAGLCVAASLVIGLETAPLLAVVGAAVVVAWIVDGDARRLAGLGAGTLVGLIAGRFVFAGDGFGYPACDGFTGEAWRGAAVLAAALLVTPALSRRPPTRAMQRAGRTPTGMSSDTPVMTATLWRALVAIGVGSIATTTALLWSPDCLHPYGKVDPLLARLWLSQVAEAQAAWHAPAAATIGYIGVMLAGLAATSWRLRRTATRGWTLLIAVQIAALAVALVQLRGAQSGAMFAAPALATAIETARRRGAVALVGAWLASAGLLYPMAAQAFTPDANRPAPMAGDCSSTATMTALAGLPAGRLIAPIDAGAWALATTPHRVLGAPLHRNAAGNRAVYAFYLAPPARAMAIARRWGVTYILACAAMPGADRPGTAAFLLTQGKLPGVHPVARSIDGSVIYLSDATRTL